MAKFNYSYHEERGEFSAYVENEAGETVWNVRYPDYYEDDETGELIEGSTIFEDGFMKNAADVNGLRDYLIDMGLMDEDDELVISHELGAELEAMKDKALEGSFELPIQMAVLVPSTINVDERISEEEFKKRITSVEEFLSSLFGGYSADPVDGGYVSSEKGLVREDVERVVAFSTQDSFRQNFGKLVYQIKQWCEDWGQEAIGYELETDLYYVSSFTSDAKRIAFPDGDDSVIAEKWNALSADEKKSNVDAAKRFFSAKIMKSGGEVDIEEEDEEQNEELEAINRLADEHDIPFDVVKEWLDETGEDADRRDLPYYGMYDNEADFVRQLVDDGVISDSLLASHLEMYPTDQRIFAQEEADFRVDSMSDDDLLEEAGYLNDIERASEIDDEIDELQSTLSDLESDLEELQSATDIETEEDIDRNEQAVNDVQSRIDEVESEISDLKHERRGLDYTERSSAVDAAKEKLREEYYDEIYKELDDDAVGYFVSNLGYEEKDLIGKGFYVDYNSLADDLEGDYTYIKHGGNVYVFNAYYAKGGVAKKPGNLRPVQRLVDEVNRLIGLAFDSDGDPIPVYDTTSTWQSPAVYLPVVYSRGTLYIKYRDYPHGFGGGFKLKKDTIKKDNMEFDGIPSLRAIASQYRKALKQAGVSYASGGTVGAFDYKTVDVSTLAGQKRAEELHAQGWRSISHGSDTIVFEKKKEPKKGVDLGASFDKMKGMMAAGGTIPGSKEFSFGITYDVVSPESAEAGDFEDSGWHSEYRNEALSEILKEANSMGIYEPSSSRITPHIWWSSVDPERDYRSGEETFYSLHVNNVDGSPISQEEAEFITQKLKLGRKLDWDDEDKEWMANGGDVSDSIKTDVPLFIRLMEYAREDAESDADLHEIAENAVIIGKGGKTLRMADYNKLVGYYRRGGKLWIQGAIKKPGALRETAKRMGLIAGDEKLRMDDLRKLEAVGGKTGQRARLAMRLRKFALGGDVPGVFDIQVFNLRINRGGEKYTTLDKRLPFKGTFDAAIEEAKKELSGFQYNDGSYANIYIGRDYAAKVGKDGEVKKYEDGGDIDNGNYLMVLNRSKAISHHADELENVLEKKPPVHAWVVAKAETVHQDLSDITHYLDGLNQEPPVEFEDGNGYEEGGQPVKRVIYEVHYKETPSSRSFKKSSLTMAGADAPYMENAVKKAAEKLKSEYKWHEYKIVKTPIMQAGGTADADNKLVEKIKAILDKELPGFFTKAYQRTSMIGGDYIAIFMATSDKEINRVSNQYPDFVSLSLDLKTMELEPQYFGGSGGQGFYVKPDLENPREKYLAMARIKVPFRKPKPDEKSVLEAIKKFAQRYKQLLIENRSRLRHSDMADYDKLLSK